MQGELIADRLPFEIHDNGGSGITISAVDIVRKGTGLAHHRLGMEPGLYPDYLPNTKVPIRIDPYDTVVVVLDAAVYNKHPGFPQLQSLDFRVEWYGSRLGQNSADHRHHRRRRAHPGLHCTYQPRLAPSRITCCGLAQTGTGFIRAGLPARCGGQQKRKQEPCGAVPASANSRDQL